MLRKFKSIKKKAQLAVKTENVNCSLPKQMNLNVAKQLKVKRNISKTRKGTYLAKTDISVIKVTALRNLSPRRRS